jgi:hypothetical protein
MSPLRFVSFLPFDDLFDKTFQILPMEVYSSNDPLGIDYHVPVSRQVEDADRIIEAFQSDRVRPIQLVPLEDLLGLRQVLFWFLKVTRINVNENHCQLVHTQALLHPLNQRESFDAGVSGDAPNVEEERFPGQALPAEFSAVGRFE